MSTLDSIKDVITQIIQESDIRKPDLFCAEDVFDELLKRPDCKIHPVMDDTVVMRPNVYWTKSSELSVPNIVANTHRGELILQYLDLVTKLIFEEQGSITDVQDIVRDLINKNK